MVWESGRPHPKPRPNQCPVCDHVGTLRENGKRVTWQPVGLQYAEDGTLEPYNYGHSEYADDVEVTHYDCFDCGAEWADLFSLAQDQRRVAALTDWMEYHNRQYDGLVGRDDVEVMEAIHESSAQAFEHALEILRGNGEA